LFCVQPYLTTERFGQKITLHGQLTYFGMNDQRQLEFPTDDNYNSLMVLSPFSAAKATFALNADEWLRRFLLMFCGSFFV